MARNTYVPPMVYGLIPEFGCYMADVEMNLKMDAAEWARYQDYPGPIALDVLLDHGTYPNEATFDQVEIIAMQAITRHYGENALCSDSYARIYEETETIVVLVKYWEVHIPLGDNTVVSLETNDLEVAKERAALLKNVGAKIWDTVNLKWLEETK